MIFICFYSEHEVYNGKMRKDNEHAYVCIYLGYMDVNIHGCVCNVQFATIVNVCMFGGFSYCRSVLKMDEFEAVSVL